MVGMGTKSLSIVQKQKENRLQIDNMEAVEVPVQLLIVELFERETR